MNITSETNGEAVVVRLEGSLDTTTAPTVQEALDGFVEEGHSLVIIDFGPTDFVSSAGLRILLATAKKLRPSGELKLFGLNPSVLEVFEMSGFSTIFAIFDDEAAAFAG